MNLAGEWRFQLDPHNEGEEKAWYSHALTDYVNLPGSIQEQGFGDDITVETQWTAQIVDTSWFTDPELAKYREPGNVKVPFFLQPDKHYVGAAWYQKEIEIPEEWENKNLLLTLERPHIETSVWLDNTFIGVQNSHSTAHQYILENITSGNHRLTIKVDNRIKVKVGINSHSITEHTQSNWNGIVGDMRLEPIDTVSISNIKATANIADKSVALSVSIFNQSHFSYECHIVVTSPYGVSQTFDGVITPYETSFKLGYQLNDNTPLWDEFAPNLIDINVEVQVGKAVVAGKSLQFGLREFTTDGTQFVVNGKKTFLRGTLECCVFPLTGYPPTNIEPWRRIFQVIKQQGFNHVRFHSWCPPEAAFQMADEIGLYLQIECASWANTDSSIGDGDPIDQWLYEEGRRIIDANGNHPSFMMMAYGNEPAGDRQQAYLKEWVTYWQKEDPRRLYTSGAGWPLIDNSDYHNLVGARIQHWGAELNSRINANPPETITDYRDDIMKLTKPYLSHETGQWCVYPNYDEIKKYTGVLKARNFEIFRDKLDENHMGDQAHDFLMASGKLQVLCYKEEIESALRTPNMGGFQLLQVNDFPGQGTALVGWLDPFWDEKGYVRTDEIRRFNGKITPLIRLPKRTFTDHEILEAEVDIAHYGEETLPNIKISWKIVNESNVVVRQDSLMLAALYQGVLNRAGRIETSLNGLHCPGKYRIVVSIDELSIDNDWDIWIYQDHLSIEMNSDNLVTNDIDQASAFAEAGGNVVLLLRKEQIKNDVKVGFSSIFWNTAWTQGQGPHTLGILCDPEHPVFSEFPTEYHSNWQWWDLIHDSAALLLDGQTEGLRPSVQLIDTWFKNRSLGLLVEAKIGEGKILISSMNLPYKNCDGVVQKQMLYSICSYVASNQFNPVVEINRDNLYRMIGYSVLLP